MREDVIMKIFISADIEGISGVVSTSQIYPNGSDYNRARMLMTEEVNAAIEGAIEAGADEIVVNDSHGPMTNILIESLNPVANLITGTPKKLGMMEGIDSTFDAAIFIGYHSRMNSGGVLCHTYHGGVNTNISVNGRNSGEFYINACVAGYFNVPVILVSGDNVLSDEVKEINNKIDTVIVKNANGRYAAKCTVPSKSHRIIIERVAEAIKKTKCISAVKINEPVDMKMTFINSGLAEVASIMPGTKLIEPNTILYRASTIIECYRAEMAMVRIACSIL